MDIFCTWNLAIEGYDNAFAHLSADLARFYDQIPFINWSFKFDVTDGGNRIAAIEELRYGLPTTYFM